MAIDSPILRALLMAAKMMLWCAWRPFAELAKCARHIVPMVTSRVIAYRRGLPYCIDRNGNVKYSQTLMERLSSIFMSHERQKRTLLSWVRMKLPYVTVSNFTSSWSDGITLCCLLEALKHGCCPKFTSLKPHQKLENCRLGLSLAAQHFSIPERVVTPEELAFGVRVTSPLLEFKVMQLVLLLKYASERQSSGDAPHATSAGHMNSRRGSVQRMVELCSVRGSGLHSGIACKPCQFIVTAPAEMLDMLIRIVGPQDNKVEKRVFGVLANRMMNRKPLMVPFLGSVGVFAQDRSRLGLRKSSSADIRAGLPADALASIIRAAHGGSPPVNSRLQGPRMFLNGFRERSLAHLRGMFSRSTCSDKDVPSLHLEIPNDSNGLKPTSASNNQNQPHLLGVSRDDSDVARKRKNFRGGSFGLRRLSPSPSVDVASYGTQAQCSQSAQDAASEEKTIPLRFEQLDDQRLRIMYVPMLVGTYTIEVLLRGEHAISGSPFTSKVTMVPQRVPLTSNTGQLVSTSQAPVADPMHNTASADLENLRAIKSHYIAQHNELQQRLSEEKVNGSANWSDQSATVFNPRRRSSMAGVDTSGGLVQRRIVRKMISSGNLTTPYSRADLATSSASTAQVVQSQPQSAAEIPPVDASPAQVTANTSGNETDLRKSPRTVCTLVTAPTLQDTGKLETVLEADERSERSSRSSRRPSLRRSCSETSDLSTSRQLFSFTDSRSTVPEALSVAHPSIEYTGSLESSELPRDADRSQPTRSTVSDLASRRSYSEFALPPLCGNDGNVTRVDKEQQVSYAEIKAETGWKRPAAFAVGPFARNRTRQPLVCVISPSVAPQNSVAQSDDLPSYPVSCRPSPTPDERPDAAWSTNAAKGVYSTASTGAHTTNTTTTTTTTTNTSCDSPSHDALKLHQYRRVSELHASTSTNLSSINLSSNPSGDEAREPSSGSNGNNSGARDKEKDGAAVMQRPGSPSAIGSFYLTGSDVNFGGMGVENRFFVHLPLRKDRKIDVEKLKVDIEGQAPSSVVYVHVEPDTGITDNEQRVIVRYRVQDRGFYRISITYLDEQRCYACKVLH